MSGHIRHGIQTQNGMGGFLLIYILFRLKEQEDLVTHVSMSMELTVPVLCLNIVIYSLIKLLIAFPTP